MDILRVWLLSRCPIPSNLEVMVSQLSCPLAVHEVKVIGAEVVVVLKMKDWVYVLHEILSS